MTTTADAPSTEAPDGRASMRPRGRGLAVALTCAALLPVATVVATRVGTDWIPVGDLAIIDLRVRDVWSSAVPLLGTYNRFGWNHPGPAMFWLLAPLSGLTGRPAWATLVGGAVLQGVAIVTVAWLAWRKGGLALVAAALALNGLAYGALGTLLLLWPWNPSIAFPFFLVVVLSAWCVADGDLVLLPLLIATATFLVQTHVGYLPLVGGAVGFAVVWAVVARRRRDLPSDEGGNRWRRPLQWSGLVLFVGWSPVVVRELLRESNFAKMARFLVESPGYARVGLGAAAGILADGFRVPPPWLGGHTRFDGFSNTVRPAAMWWLAVPTLLFVVAVVAVWRPPARNLRVLVALTALLSVIGLWAVAGVTGPAEPYVFYWRIPLSLLVVFVALGAAWHGLGIQRYPSARITGFTLLVVIVLSSSTALSLRTAQTGDVLSAESTAGAALAQLHRDGEPRGSVLVRVPDVSYLGLSGGVIDELVRDRGNRVKIDPTLGFQYGSSRSGTAAQVDEVVYVVEGGQYLSVLSGEPGAKVLWSTRALPAEQEQELRVLQRQVWSELRAAHRTRKFAALGSGVAAIALANVAGVDQKAVDRIAQLNADAAKHAPCRCAIVAFPAAGAPAVNLLR